MLTRDGACKSGCPFDVLRIINEPENSIDRAFNDTVAWRFQALPFEVKTVPVTSPDLGELQVRRSHST